MSKIKAAIKWFFSSFIWLGIILLAIDIITKNVVVHFSDYIQNEPIVLIPGFLRINYVINPNIAFGMSLGSVIANKIVFSIIALGVSTGIIIYLIKKWGKINKFFRVCFILIITGAIGNVIDRLFYSPEYLNYIVNGEYVAGVVDWIDFYGIWKFNFNIADSSVVVAALMLLVYMIIDTIKEAIANRKKEKEEDNTKVKSRTELEKEELLKEDNNEENREN